ncbi:hypothetical protein LCGC14_0437380 [marine sediment metagenome]|uniref:Uncharacterized protein n=1 Tax=marine sediment metagenome TaxID=412755 RepID=A0A0F9T4M8_9ZZZZ
MDSKTFDKLVEQETKRMKDVMCSKSADYSADDDKLFNFKLAAKLDGVSPIEALRGMWLKHRTSLRQGLDELIDGKCRPEKWWIEKLTDDRNYNILLQALLMEKYFKPFVVPEGWRISFVDIGEWCGWQVKTKMNEYLYKDNELHKDTTGWNNHNFDEAPGYWPTEKEAKAALAAYLEKEKT